MLKKIQETLEGFVSDERNLTQRVLALVLFFVIGVAVGMLFSPPESITVGSYNGNYSGNNAPDDI